MNKKLFTLLALNTLAAIPGEAAGIKTDRLYNNITKNVQAGKSNNENYKLIENILKQKNKELKDLYLQGDYIVKPEYLEWQIFFSSFYSENSKGEQKNIGKIIMTDSETQARIPKQYKFGVTIPMKTITDLNISPELKIDKLAVQPITVNAPGVIPIKIPIVTISSITLPEITIDSITLPTAPEVTPINMNVLSVVEVPEIILPDITVVNFKIDNPAVIGTNYTGVSTGGTITSTTVNTSDSTVSSIKNSSGTYQVGSGQTLTLNGNKNIGVEILENKSSNTLNAVNNGTIILNGDGTGTVKNQAAFLLNNETVASTRQISIINNGTININSSESVGIQLRPDAGGILEYGSNSTTGIINVNGYRSYGMMTVPNNKISGGGQFYKGTGTSSSLENVGTINVQGDEASAFSLQYKIRDPLNWKSTSIINIGMSDPNQNGDGNIPGNNPNLVEGAMGLYSQVTNDYYIDGAGKKYGLGALANYGTINIGEYALNVAGVRSEGGTADSLAAVTNQSGNIKITGKGNYGVVVNSEFATGSNGTDLRYGVAGQPRKQGLIDIKAGKSVGILVLKGGKGANTGIINIDLGNYDSNLQNENSIGFYIVNGTGENLNRDTVVASQFQSRGQITTTGKNAHAVVVKREVKNAAGTDYIDSTFTNNGLIQNNTAGTIGIYAENGASIIHTGFSTSFGKSEIISGAGAIGIYAKGLKDSSDPAAAGDKTTVTVSGPITVGNSTGTNTSVGILAEGDTSEVTFNTGAKLSLGNDSIGILLKNTNIADSIKINALQYNMGNNSIFLYGEKSTLKISDSLTALNGTAFSSLGTDSTMLYAANNSHISIDSDITLPLSGKPSLFTNLYVAENSDVTLENGNTLTITPAQKTGLVSFSADGKYFSDGTTAVVIDNTKTGSINKGIININSDNSVGMYTLYGTAKNDSAGVVNAAGQGSVGMFGEENSIIENKGTLTQSGVSSIGIYGKTESDKTLVPDTHKLAINNSGTINVNSNGSLGIYASNNSTDPAVSKAESVINHTSSGTHAINVAGTKSVGIFADKSTVKQNGNINLTGTNSVGVYGRSGTEIIGGGIIDLNTNNQNQVAYYIEGNTGTSYDGTKLTGSLGTINGYGIGVYAKNAEIDDSWADLDVTAGAGNGNGVIALALVGNSKLDGYTGTIKTGDTVGTNYAAALYLNGQNISAPGLSTNLSGGSNAVGLYAANGSNLSYSGTINVGNGITAGTGIYIGGNSTVTLKGQINLNGDNGVGTYIESGSTFTFDTGSTMNFYGNGVGYYGVAGSVINDNGGTINANGHVVERVRSLNGTINITANTTIASNNILGHVINGEMNINSGVTVNSKGDGIVGIFADGMKTAGSNPYEGNNFGTIDLSVSNSSTGMYLSNARGQNKGTIKIKDDGIGIYGVNINTDIYNEGLISVGENSAGIYGDDIKSVTNLSVGSIESTKNSNVGIYIKTGADSITNAGTINLSDDSTGIYGENTVINNNGNIAVGNKAETSSVGIYGMGSVINNTGNIKTGKMGVAFYAENSVININSGNIDISDSGTMVYGNYSTINYNSGIDLTASGEPLVYLINSSMNFNGVDISASKGGVTLYQEGISSITGYNNLILGTGATGIYGVNTDIINSGQIKTGENSIGITGIDSNINNNSTISGTEKGTGIYSELNTSGRSTVINNNSSIILDKDQSVGIYINTTDNAGNVLGSTTVNNIGSIQLGNASSLDTAAIGIYGTGGVTINNSGSVNAGTNSIGLYSKNGSTITNGGIILGDQSVGVYQSGGTAVTAGNISVGDNGGVALFADNGAELINNSANVSAGTNSVLGYSKNSGTKLINNGNLTVGTENVGFYTNSGKIENNGILTSTGDGVIFLYGKSGEIVNNNKLDSSTNDYGVGIYGENTNIINNNDILVKNSIITDLDNLANEANRFAVGIYGNSGKIENTGNIQIGERGIGIYSYNQSGDIVNAGQIKSSSDYAMGIYASNGNGYEIKNTGSIELSGKEVIGIAANTNTVVRNTGSIIIAGENSVGILAEKNSKVYNTGTISISGSQTAGIILRANSVLENTGTIILGSGAASVLTDQSGGTVVSGSDYSELSGIYPSFTGTTYSLPRIVNAGVIKVDGKFEVPYGGVVAVKVEPSTFRIPTQEEITSKNYASEDINSKFLVSDAVKYIADGFNIKDITISKDFTQGTNSTVYKLENLFNLKEGIGTVISESITWQAIPDTTESGLDVWMSKIDYTDYTSGTWLEDFSGAMDKNYDGSAGKAGQIYDKIDNITSLSDFNHKMSSLAGNVYANMNQRENDIVRTLENSLDLLQDSKNNTKENVKINVIAGKGKLTENTDGVTGYNYESVGVQALREVERTYKHTFGYSAGYFHTNYEMNDGNSSEEDADTIQLGFHNKYRSNDWILRNDVLGRVSIYNTDRNIDWINTGRSQMTGMYETYSISSNNKLGKEITLGKNTSITPYGGLDVMYITRPTFSEDGLEALEVRGNDAWSVKPKAGVELKGEVPLKDQWKLKGALDVAYGYELGDLNEREYAKLVNIETDYHKLSKPEEEKGILTTKATIGVEIEDRYGIFLTGEYKTGNNSENEYRAGVTLKAVF